MYVRLQTLNRMTCHVTGTKMCVPESVDRYVYVRRTPKYVVCVAEAGRLLLQYISSQLIDT